MPRSHCLGVIVFWFFHWEALVRGCWEWSGHPAGIWQSVQGHGQCPLRHLKSRKISKNHLKMQHWQSPMAIRSNSKRHLGSAQPTQEQNEENKISKEGKTLDSLMTFYWLLTEPLYIDRNEEFGQQRKSPPGPLFSGTVCLLPNGYVSFALVTFAPT